MKDKWNTSVLFCVSAVLFYLAAIITLAVDGIDSMGVIWLSLGSTFLCFGTVLRKSGEEKKNAGEEEKHPDQK